jgi:putative ABC transport system substrate-binding protein
VIRLGGDGDSSELEPPLAALTDGLRQGGAMDGVDYSLMVLDAEGDANKIPELVEKAIQARPAMIVTLLLETTRAAAGAVKDIPLVFYIPAAKPFALGLGKDLSDHAANATGAFISLEQSTLLAMARGCLPKAEKFGVVVNPDDPVSGSEEEGLARADSELISVRPEVETAEARSNEEIPAAIESLASRGAKALLLVPALGLDPITLIETARQHKIPSFGYTGRQAEAGAAIARVPDPRWGGFEAGRRAARILHGEKPVSIPIARGPSFASVINQKAAKDLGFEVLGPFLRDARMVPAKSE